MPQTPSIPKPLLPVRNIPIIEKQIQFLHDKNITEIHIILRKNFYI